MENFNKASLKSAVKKYGQLHIDGKAVEDVKAEIALDERAFTEEQIDAIYDGIVNPAAETPKETPKGNHSVVEGKSFRDINDFSIEYNDQSDISHLSQDRIDHLIEQGIVE